MGHCGALNPKGFGGFRIQVKRNADKGTLLCHSFAVITVDDRTPGVGMTVTLSHTDYSEANLFSVSD
jgi:hypothetical protein